MISTGRRLIRRSRGSISSDFLLFYTPRANLSRDDRETIGTREVVGFGANGAYTYHDRFSFPYPAIRFRDCTPDLLALREKERGNWRGLTREEKKSLYRYSFCQTFAEMQAPTGQWKSILAGVLWVLGSSFWVFAFTKSFVFVKAPCTFSEEHRAAQYFRQEAINNQPFSGNYRPKFVEKYQHLDRPS